MNVYSGSLYVPGQPGAAGAIVAGTALPWIKSDGVRVLDISPQPAAR